MTTEEAIRILDPETTKEELAEIKGYAEMMKVVDEACMLAVDALREQEQRRWIPVTERLPEQIACSAGTAYSDAVNVLTSGRKVITAIWDGTDWIGSFRFWDAEGEEITHWAPVLLPTPEMPKEEREC